MIDDGAVMLAAERDPDAEAAILSRRNPMRDACGCMPFPPLTIKERPMAMAGRPVQAPRRPLEAALFGHSRLHRRMAALLRRFLAELAALPDRGPASDDLPPESHRFPPF